jgi:murein L,D-transpeptidase YafK
MIPFVAPPLNRRIPANRYLIAIAFAMAAALSHGPASAEGMAAQPPAEWEKYATPKADKIVVYKSLRRMELWRGNTILRTYHVALGRSPRGQKTSAGDGRTPEGTYFIDDRKMMSDYHLALHISYPGQTDIERAESMGVSAGGSIMIHGVPNDLTPDQRLAPDWTAGCIALTNPEIEEVWRLVDDGTTVQINP